MKVVDTILPSLLVMLLGYFLTRRGFLGPEFVDGLNRLLYFVALPAMILASLLSEPMRWGAVGPILGVFAASSLVVLAGAALLAVALRYPVARGAVLVQAAFRGNQALIGLPLLIYAVGPERAPAVTAQAVLVLAPVMLSYNVLSVLVLSLIRRGSNGPGHFWSALLSLRTNPLILTTLAGLLLAAGPVRLPGFLLGTTRTLAATASPLALLAIGALLAGAHLGREWRPALLATVGKCAVLPLLAWALGHWAELPADSMRILLFFAATPTAAASVVLARQMGGDEKLASSAVAISTLFSMIPLSVAVALYA